VQYTLGRSYGNTGGSNEAQTSACNALETSAFDCENGYNNFDVRHTFNLSLLYSIPYGSGRAHTASGIADLILGGWDVGQRLGQGPQSAGRPPPRPDQPAPPAARHLHVPP
jgi:hypothetical protein